MLCTTKIYELLGDEIEKKNYVSKNIYNNNQRNKENHRLYKLW